VRARIQFIACVVRSQRILYCETVVSDRPLYDTVYKHRLPTLRPLGLLTRLYSTFKLRCRSKTDKIQFKRTSQTVLASLYANGGRSKPIAFTFSYSVGLSEVDVWTTNVTYKSTRRVGSEKNLSTDMTSRFTGHVYVADKSAVMLTARYMILYLVTKRR